MECLKGLKAKCLVSNGASNDNFYFTKSWFLLWSLEQKFDTSLQRNFVKSKTGEIKMQLLVAFKDPQIGSQVTIISEGISWDDLSGILSKEKLSCQSSLIPMGKLGAFQRMQNS